MDRLREELDQLPLPELDECPPPSPFRWNCIGHNYTPFSYIGEADLDHDGPDDYEVTYGEDIGKTKEEREQNEKRYQDALKALNKRNAKKGKKK